MHRPEPAPSRSILKKTSSCEPPKLDAAIIAINSQAAVEAAAMLEAQDALDKLVLELQKEGGWLFMALNEPVGGDMGFRLKDDLTDDFLLRSVTEEEEVDFLEGLFNDDSDTTDDEEESMSPHHKRNRSQDSLVIDRHRIGSSPRRPKSHRPNQDSLVITKQRILKKNLFPNEQDEGELL